jgi:hypothetical protein
MPKTGVAVESVRREKGKIVAIRIRYRFEDGEVGYDLIFRPEGRNLGRPEKLIRCSIPDDVYNLMKKTAYAVLRKEEKTQQMKTLELLRQAEFCFEKLP